MDIIEKVRKTAPEIGGADENLISARARLLMEIESERRPVRPAQARRRQWVLVGSLVGATAAVTAAALVVVNITAPSTGVDAVPAPPPIVGQEQKPFPKPSSLPMSAGEALNAAADAAAGSAEVLVSPGQYLRREWVTEEVMFYDGSLHQLGTAGMGGSRATATSAWKMRFTGVQYIPQDLSSAWLGDASAPTVTALFGDEGEAEVQSQAYIAANSEPYELAPFEQLPPWPGDDGVDTFASFFSSMPRDPQALITWIRSRFGEDLEGWADGKLGWFLIDLLSYNVGPPDARAAMLRALSSLPSATVSDAVEGIRTITFDSRLAVGGTSDFFVRRMTISLDMNSGIVQEVTSTLEEGPGVVPAEVPDLRVRASVSIVDRLP